MAQLEELLEKKPDAVSEDMGYSTPSDAYPEDEWEKQNFFRAVLCIPRSPPPAPLPSGLLRRSALADPVPGTSC